jgi:D-arabinose 1-dehydrogenase-like Zn-dependent alcohol dehydrogenase
MSLQASRLSLNSESKQLETTTFELAELGEHEVRIQVLFNAISRNDVLMVEGKHGSDFFGPAAVGRVVAVGKAVGSRKVGEAVGVFHKSVNRGSFKSGFSSYLQVEASDVVFIPTSIPLEQASSLLSDGVVAFNSLERLPQGAVIAVIGTGNLAYLTVQFAKRVFGHHVTVFSLASSEGVAESLGADAADVYSIPNTKKYEEKFDAVIVTEPIIGEEQSKPLQNLAIRTGKLFFATQFSYAPSLVVMDLIVCKASMI